MTNWIVVTVVIIIAVLLIAWMINYFTRPETMESLGNRSEEKSLYDRLGGIYPIAAVVNHFSDAVMTDALVGKNAKNPQLREWAKNQEERLPGLKWMRTLWVASITGGPYKYVPTVSGKCPMSLEKAHAKLKISGDEFDRVAKLLSQSLDYYKVPPKEKNEVLAAFGAHKKEVIAGYTASKGGKIPNIVC